MMRMDASLRDSLVMPGGKTLGQLKANARNAWAHYLVNTDTESLDAYDRAFNELNRALSEYLNVMG
jgi:hypothetical protein